MISNIGVIIYSPGYYMVNIQLATQSLLGYTAALAGIIISLASLIRLTFPVSPPIVITATKPSRTISSFLKVGVLKPIIFTSNTTKYMDTALTRHSHYYFPAGSTNFGFPVILRMFYSRDSVLFPILRKALTATKKVLKNISSAVRPDNYFPAIRAMNFYSYVSCSVSASCGAVFLIRMLRSRLEVNKALRALFKKMFASGLISTGNRAKSYYSIFSLRYRLSAKLARFHYFKYNINEGVCQV